MVLYDSNHLCVSGNRSRGGMVGDGFRDEQSISVMCGAVRALMLLPLVLGEFFIMTGVHGRKCLPGRDMGLGYLAYGAVPAQMFLLWVPPSGYHAVPMAALLSVQSSIMMETHRQKCLPGLQVRSMACGAVPARMCLPWGIAAQSCTMTGMTSISRAI